MRVQLQVYMRMAVSCLDNQTGYVFRNMAAGRQKVREENHLTRPSGDRLINCDRNGWLDQFQESGIHQKITITELPSELFDQATELLVCAAPAAAMGEH